MQGPARHREVMRWAMQECPSSDEWMDGWIDGDGYDMCVRRGW